MNKPTINLISISFVLAFLVVSCTTPATEPPPPDHVTLKMNSSQLTSYAPIFIADSEGFFEEEGITMEYIPFNRTTDALPLVISEDLDIFASALTSGLINVMNEEPSVRAVADRGVVTSDDTCANHGILFRKDLYDSGELKGPADLKGKTIASSESGPSGYLLKRYLEQAGLTFKDVIISDIPTASYIEAIANGTVDAIVSSEVRLTQVIREGNAVLGVRGADVYGRLQTSVLVFGKRLLVDDQEIGIRFLRAYMKGVQQYQAGKTDRNVEIMMEHTGETEDVIRQSCWITISPDGRMDFQAGVLPFLEWSFEQDEIDNIISEEQFWDPSLLESAVSQ